MFFKCHFQYSPIQSSQQKKNYMKLINNIKSRGQDLTTGQINASLWNNTCENFSTVFCDLLTFSTQFAQIILIPKSGKSLTDLTSYCSISLLPLLSKVLEKLFLNYIIENRIQNTCIRHQFAFWRQHFTIQKCHRFVDTVRKPLENKSLCTSVVNWIRQGTAPRATTQAKENILASIFKLFQSYLEDRYYQQKLQFHFTLNTCNNRCPPREGSLLNLLHFSDIPTNNVTDVNVHW